MAGEVTMVVLVQWMCFRKQKPVNVWTLHFHSRHALCQLPLNAIILGHTCNQCPSSMQRSHVKCTVVVTRLTSLFPPPPHPTPPHPTPLPEELLPYSARTHLHHEPPRTGQCIPVQERHRVPGRSALLPRSPPQPPRLARGGRGHTSICNDTRAWRALRPQCPIPGGSGGELGCYGLGLLWIGVYAHACRR